MNPDTLIKKHVAPVVDAPTPTAEETQATDAALESIKNELPSLLFGDKPKAKVDAPPATVAPVEPAAPVAPVEPEPPKTRARRVPDALEIARVTAMETARAFEQQRAAAPAPVVASAPEDPAANLTPDDKENYEVFKFLAESDPAKYKDAHQKFLGFTEKLIAYKRRWEKANTGETFDPEDAAHETFYAANQPQYNESDFQRARVRKEAKQEIDSRLEQERRRYDDRLTAIESKAMGSEVSRVANHAAGEATNAILESVEDAGVKEALLKGVESLQKADPVAFQVLDRSVAQLQEQIVELHNIARRPKYFDGRNPVHNYIAQFVDTQEQKLAQLPAKSQMHEGRMFATRQQYSSLTPAQQQRYWTLGESDISYMLTQETKGRVNHLIGSERKRVEEMAAAYGYTKGPASKAPQPVAGQAPAKAPATAPKPAAPSAGDGGATAPAGTPAAVDTSSVGKKLVSSLF